MRNFHEKLLRNFVWAVQSVMNCHFSEATEKQKVFSSGKEIKVRNVHIREAVITEQAFIFWEQKHVSQVALTLETDRITSLALLYQLYLICRSNR